MFKDEDIINFIKEKIDELNNDGNIFRKSNRDIKTYISAYFYKAAKREVLPETKQEVPTKTINYINPTTDGGSTFIILGRSYTGKTTFLMNQLKQLNKNDYFLTIIFSESINTVPFQELKNIKLDYILINKLIKPIIGFIKKVSDALLTIDRRYKFLFILDDVYDTHSKGISKMYTILRNSNISTIVLTQYSKMITPAVRANTHHIFITNLRNDDMAFIIKSFSLKSYFQGKSINQAAENAIQLLKDNNTLFHHDSKRDMSEIIKY